MNDMHTGKEYPPTRGPDSKQNILMTLQSPHHTSRNKHDARRRSDTQVVLSHPIIFKSLQQLQNQPSPRSTPTLRSFSNHPTLYHTSRQPSSMSSHQTSQSVSSRKRTLNSRNRHSVAAASLSRNPSLTAISHKSTQAPAVVIKHGLPSPPPTVRSDNGSLHGTRTAVDTPGAGLSIIKNKPASVRSQLSSQSHPPGSSSLSSGHVLPRQPPSSSSALPPKSLPAPLPPNSTTSPSSSSVRRHAPNTRRSSWVSTSSMKAAEHESPQAPEPSTHQRLSSGSKPTSHYLSRASSLRQSKTPAHLRRTDPYPSLTAHGPMSSSGFTLDLANPNPQYISHNPPKLSTSVLSDATVRPKHRTPSESSSTDLRVSKLKFKDRSKEPSSATPNHDSHPVSKSKKLMTMKERNERIFASINASLNPPSRTGSIEPPLPPPPPSPSVGSPNSPPRSITFPSTEMSGSRLKVPARTGSISGLIPFAQGSSPNPRKVTSSQSQATDARIDPCLLDSPAMDTETTDDEKTGSVRHKRPERCRLLKRTSVVETTSPPLNIKSPPSEKQFTGMHEDDLTKQVEPESFQHSSNTMDRPFSVNSHRHRENREWSETVSTHTSSSDTIGANDRDQSLRSSSRDSMSYHRASSQSSQDMEPTHSDEDQNDSGDGELVKEEIVITPVKARRAESFQKTLRHANSVGDMLSASGRHDPPLAWTPRVTSGRSRCTSSSDNLRDVGPPTGKGSSANSSPNELESASHLSSSQGVPRSPQSHASISRRQRPGLPDHFIQSRHPDRVGNEINHMADSHGSEQQSSLSPRSHRTRLTHLSSLQQQADSQSYRRSDTFIAGPDRLNGVESALSRYDGHHSYSDRLKYQSIRNKHASWSVLDELGKDLPRSQSVLGGAYDARISESRQVGPRPRTTYTSPISRRFANYRPNGVEDDDDDQTSTTTYTNIHSMPRKAGSADSRSRTSDWGLEDPEHRHRSVHSASRVGGHANGLIMSPTRRQSILEKDRTLRGNGGSVVPTPKPFTQLLRNTHQEKKLPSHNADNLSSSSGTNSSNRLQSQRSLNTRPSPAARLANNASRLSRPPTRATSLAAIGLTALLSPTPTVDHHNLLISAYEALDCYQEEHTKEANDLHSTLIGLLSSVVKNSCKIDATLTQLNESSLNHQVDMELADDHIGNEPESNMHSKQPWPDSVSRQKYFMMKENLAHMTKVQGQLVRTSNDQIRDLTEALICLSKLHRSQKECATSRPTGLAAARGSVSDDPREFYGHADTKSKDGLRSGSRACSGYSRSHSPSKLRHTIDLSPLSVISSHDGSPFPKVQADRDDLSPRSIITYSQRLGASVTSPRTQHNRASTISFAHDRHAHDRYLSIDGVAARAQKRASAFSCTSASQIRESSSLLRSNSQSSVAVDEFGLYRKPSGQALRSPVEFKYPHQDIPWSRTDSAGNTIRGSQPSVVFPKTPPRLATSSLSQATAHSHVSPTRPQRDSIDSRGQRVERGDQTSYAMRPASSMSKVLDRAHHVLSRTGNYPTVSAGPSGRKENGNHPERYTKGPSLDEPRISTRRNPGHVPEGQRNGERLSGEVDVRRQSREQQSRSSSTATAALQRLNLAGGWNGGYHHSDQEATKLSRSSTYSHLPSSRDPEDDQDSRRDSMRSDHLRSGELGQAHRRGRKGSIQKLFGGLKRNPQLKG